MNGYWAGIGEGDGIIENVGLKAISKIAGYSSRIAAQILKADGFVRNLAVKIEQASPRLLKNVEKIIKDNDGRILTDFDIEIEKHIIEVASGNGRKFDQIMNKTKC